MPKVLTTEEYKAIEAKSSNSIQFELTKVEKYNLKPYGNYTIKWKTRQGHLPYIIPFDELRIFYDTLMPISDEQDKQIVKFMKKHKTDILTDGRDDFYTRASTGFVKVWHKHLVTEYFK